MVDRDDNIDTTIDSYALITKLIHLGYTKHYMLPKIQP